MCTHRQTARACFKRSRDGIFIFCLGQFGLCAVCGYTRVVEGGGGMIWSHCERIIQNCELYLASYTRIVLAGMES